MAEKAKISKLTRPRLTKYIPHKLTLRQAIFLSLPHEEAFYGGAAGGGKSDALLAGALQYADVPGFNALILRRSYADLMLPEALMERGHEWLDDSDAKWNAKDRRWEFPSGATLGFGYLKTENDKYRYKSAAFQYIAFDELTQFTRTQYLFLFSRLRRLSEFGVPLRMRSGSNPGDLGHEWVKDRFVDPGHPSRPFVPSNLEDNPFLDQETYARALEKLDAVTWAQMRHGDWDVMPQGGKFERAWFNMVPVAPAGARKVRFWDLAATEPKYGNDPDWTVGALVSLTREGRLCIEDIVRLRGTPGRVERKIRETSDRDGLNVVVAMEQEPGASGKSLVDMYRRKVLTGRAFYGIRSTGPKEVRANPVSAQAQGGNVDTVMAPWNDTMFDEMEVFPYGAHDDQVDAVSGAFHFLSRNREWKAY